MFYVKINELPEEILTELYFFSGLHDVTEFIEYVEKKYDGYIVKYIAFEGDYEQSLDGEYIFHNYELNTSSYKFLALGSKRVIGDRVDDEEFEPDVEVIKLTEYISKETIVVLKAEYERLLEIEYIYKKSNK